MYIVFVICNKTLFFKRNLSYFGTERTTCITEAPGLLFELLIIMIIFNAVFYEQCPDFLLLITIIL